jgi:hypothetical protein
MDPRSRDFAISLRNIVTTIRSEDYMSMAMTTRKWWTSTNEVPSYVSAERQAQVPLLMFSVTTACMISRIAAVALEAGRFAE